MWVDGCVGVYAVCLVRLVCVCLVRRVCLVCLLCGVFGASGVSVVVVVVVCVCVRARAQVEFACELSTVHSDGMCNSFRWYVDGGGCECECDLEGGYDCGCVFWVDG